MGVSNNAAIIAIGAIKFDPRGVDILDAFYTRVDLGSSIKAGLKVDGSTVDWWLDEERAEARRALKKSDPVALWEVLTSFIDWYEKPIPETAPFDGDRSSPIAGVWGNGATFDNVVLRNAFNALNLDAPWSFRLDRCYRTLKGLAPDIPAEVSGTAHQALDDAHTQVIHMQAICDELGIDP
jgi:exodeoxyribonuclease VIII